MASVWYTGTASSRTLDLGDWDRAGVGDEGTFEWSQRNGWSLPHLNFTPQQLAWLDSQDDFYVGAPDYPRSVPYEGGEGDLYVRLVGEDDVDSTFLSDVYGNGVHPVPDDSLPSGYAYRVQGRTVRAVREPSVPSGYTYVIEEI